MLYSIVSKEKGTVISTKAKIADSFILRFRGLMFRKAIDEKEALIFYHTPAIHSCFMQFAIDILFLDRENKVIRICEALEPWRMVFCPRAALTIEFPAHRCTVRSVHLGDILEITASA